MATNISGHAGKTIFGSLQEWAGRRWRRRTRSDFLLVLVYVILVAYAVLALMPLYWTYVLAFRPSKGFIEFPPAMYPRNATLANFVFLLEHTPVLRWILNTVIFAGAITVTNCFFASLAGYSFAKKSFPARNILFWIVLSTMMIPWQVTIVPLFIMVNDLKWINTYAGLIVPQMVGGFGIFLMKQFIQTLPTELIDAAKIDGCSEFGVYAQIILPLAVPGLAVLAIFTFMGMWNALLWPLLITSSDTMRTLQVGLALLKSRFWTEYGHVMAGGVLSATPMIAMFFALQKYFAKGLTVGALKG